MVSYLEPYGGDYFSFVLIGIAFADYLSVASQNFASSIRESQMMGTMEALLVTQAQLPTIILSSSLYSFIIASIRVIAYLVLGALAFDVDIGGANVPAALLILVLTITAFSSLGIISASFVMVLKRGDPLSWIFSSVSVLFGGVFYPIAVLPAWLQKISFILPITYALEGMRLSLLKGYSIRALLPNFVALIIFCAVLLPLSLLVFNYAVRKAKADGTLTQY